MSVFDEVLRRGGLYGFVQNLRTGASPVRLPCAHKSCSVSDLGEQCSARHRAFWFGNEFALHSSMTIKKQEEWRELCALVAEESDPHRLSELADELIRALDERKEELIKRGERCNSYTDNT